MLSLILLLFLFVSPLLTRAQTICGSGYRLGNITNTPSAFVAELQLLDSKCTGLSSGIKDLKLTVQYQTDARLHVLIEDAAQQVYQVQEDFLPRPPAGSSTADGSLLKFDYTDNPFSFKITRKSNGGVLFDTSHAGYSDSTQSTLIFEPQYVRLRTSLPKDANIYGLGEHSDSFRLASKYTRTLWNSENPFIPRNQNLYGSHPVYFDHRGSDGTHAVFLLNANGMDVKLDQTADGGQYLEYNTLGGVLDFYFLAGPEPHAVSRQYTEVVGRPAMMPYWTLGFHQCKFGWDSLDVINGVVANYSQAQIPLEGVWADINYMDGHKDFTADPSKFPLEEFQTLTSNLHAKNQHLVAILDPGIKPEPGYPTFVRGSSQDVFLKAADGKSYYTGNQWPGQVVWPDWFHPNTTDWWTTEIELFFDPQSGLNISGLWNDMNEASNMCSISGFNSSCDSNVLPATSTFSGAKKGLPDRNLFHPPTYQIANHWGDISSNTLFTNVSNHDGTYQYDTHNLYGSMMARASYSALLSRSPNKRPFVLTRSNFPGSGRHSAHWFGDNASTWDDYRITIRQMLSYVAMHAISMVGADVCGFNFAAQEKMCARWAMLGAFQPFFRNHADQSAPAQEFYRWELVTRAAKRAIDARYRLLDYLYTGMHAANRNLLGGGGTVVQPLWFVWPGDKETWGIESQWVFGGGLLVSPVVEDDVMEVRYYLPPTKKIDTKDGRVGMRYYDFWTGKRVQDEELGWRTETNVSFTDIPVHFIGGNIVPMRVESGMTTAEVRQKNLTVVVAPSGEDMAKGWLYLDDGISLDVGQDYSEIEFLWDGKSKVLEARGTFGYKTDVVVESVTVLGFGQDGASVTQTGAWALGGGFTVQF